MFPQIEQAAKERLETLRHTPFRVLEVEEC